MNLYVGIKLGDKADGSLSAQLVVCKASYFGLSLMRREDAKLSSRTLQLQSWHVSATTRRNGRQSLCREYFTCRTQRTPESITC